MSDDLFGFDEPQGFGEDQNQRGDAKKTGKNGQKFIPPGPWDEFPALWDKLTVDGEELPGIATVTVERKNRYDDEKAKGQHKGTKKFSGVDAAKIKIHWYVWESTDYDDLRDKHLKKIEPDPTKDKPTSIKLGHAVLTLRKVSWVAVDKVSGPEVSDGIGKFEVDATEVDDPSTKNATGTIGPGTAKGNTRCQQLAEEYRECQQRDAKLRGDRASMDQEVYMGISPNGRANFEEDRAARVDQNTALRNQNHDRMEQIADEQRRLGCASAQVSSDPTAASATASSYSGPS